MIAITAAASVLESKRLADAILYSTLEPCPMCASALGWSQVSGLVYGASDEQKGFTKIDGQLLHPKTQVASGVLAAECSQLIKDFFKNKRI